MNVAGTNILNARSSLCDNISQVESYDKICQVDGRNSTRSHDNIQQVESFEQICLVNGINSTSSHDNNSQVERFDNICQVPSSTLDVFPWKENIILAGNSSKACQLDGSSSMNNSIQSVTNVKNYIIPTISLETTEVGNTDNSMKEGFVLAGSSTQICQLDGNTSLDTTIPNVTSAASLSEPAVPSTNTVPKHPRVNNRINASAYLPVIAVINCRSLQPKLRSLVEKFQNEDYSIAVLCEIWEKTGKKNSYFQSKVEEMLELDGLKYLSCGSRPSGKRGGGVAILIDSRKLNIEKLQIHVPNNLEVLWAIVRPKEPHQGSQFKEYVVCSFYSPPSSRKNRKLLDHVISTTHALMARFPSAAFYLAGDKNDLPLACLIQGLPKFAQIVANFTHGEKIIDVLLTNCSQLYAVPEISSPLLPDKPQCEKPSDHSVPVARPLCLASQPVSNVYTEKTCRPLPDSAVREFMQWVHTESWDSVPANGSTTAQVEAYEKIIESKVNQLFS